MNEKKLTAKQQVLQKYPTAQLVRLDAKTVMDAPTFQVCLPDGSELGSEGTNANQAWNNAAKALTKGPLTDKAWEEYKAEKTAPGMADAERDIKLAAEAYKDHGNGYVATESGPINTTAAAVLDFLCADEIVLGEPTLCVAGTDKDGTFGLRYGGDVKQYIGIDPASKDGDKAAVTVIESNDGVNFTVVKSEVREMHKGGVFGPDGKEYKNARAYLESIEDGPSNASCLPRKRKATKKDRRKAEKTARRRNRR